MADGVRAPADERRPDGPPGGAVDERARRRRDSRRHVVYRQRTFSKPGAVERDACRRHRAREDAGRRARRQSDPCQHAAARPHCDGSPELSRRGEREESRHHRRGAARARAGDDSDGPLRRPRRVRPRRRVSALRCRGLHYRRCAAGRRRPDPRPALIAMSVARKTLLALSTNAWLRDHATKTAFVRRSVSAFMPGERLEDAMTAAAAQQPRGIGTIFTKLGENLTRIEDAEEVTLHYLDVLDQVTASGLDAQISVKPTQLGLDLDKELCFRNLQRLIDRAEARGNFVWIDMESSPYVDPTLDLFRRTRARSARIGIAIQAYLFRTSADVESLIPLGAAIRLVKGAYLEPASIAFPKKADVDENFFKLSVRLLQEDARRSGALLHMATHDARLVDRLTAHIDAHQVPRSAYEFAMLYGIQRPLQQRLVKDGRPLRVLIAYGEYWFAWYMRRLAERPANVWFVVKNIVR